jgi:hypothetical protein
MEQVGDVRVQSLTDDRAAIGSIAGNPARPATAGVAVLVRMAHLAGRATVFGKYGRG